MPRKLFATQDRNVEERERMGERKREKRGWERGCYGQHHKSITAAAAYRKRKCA